MTTMKAIIIKEGVKVPMTTGSVMLIFDPKEAEVAIWDLELLASQLEKNAKKRCGTDGLWEVALELRKLHKVHF